MNNPFPPLLFPVEYSKREYETEKYIDITIEPGQAAVRYELPPYIIYHYTSLYVSELIIKNRQLKFSAPSTFNDPFDMYEGLIDMHATAQERKEWMKRLTAHLSRPNKRSLKKKANIRDNFTQANLHSIKALKEDCGVCCFSKKYDVQLMWSHYAQKHTGICLGFNFNPVNYRPDYNLFIRPVKYPDRIESLNFFSNRDKAVDHFLTTKSKAWEYEQEVRAILIDRKGNDLIEFERACLREVYFGCRVSMQDIDATVKLLEKYNYKQVTFKKMIIDKSTFDIKAIDL